jgi:hypothetical protein
METRSAHQHKYLLTFPCVIAGYAEYLGLDRAKGIFHVPKHLDKKFEMFPSPVEVNHSLYKIQTISKLPLPSHLSTRYWVETLDRLATPAAFGLSTRFVICPSSISLDLTSCRDTSSNVDLRMPWSSVFPYSIRTF